MGFSLPLPLLAHKFRLKFGKLHPTSVSGRPRVLVQGLVLSTAVFGR